VRRILEVSRMPEFSGRFVLVEDYSIAIAQRLVAGCDLWLNTPTPPLEASGTSGMKAGMNGVLNLSVADGWWPEAYNAKNGWLFGGESGETREFQDAYDSAKIYSLLEHEVIPRFAERDGAGVPQAWVAMMQESIASIVPRFSMVRTALEYDDKLYRPAMAEGAALEANGFTSLTEIAAARQRLIDAWPGVTFTDVQVDGLEAERLTVGEPIRARVELRHPGLRAKDLEVQAVFAEPQASGVLGEFRVVALEPGRDGQEASTWRSSIVLDESGARSLGFRVIPKAANGAVPGDLRLVRWL
jgi:starch phosphorylase